jgi:hypothetical protein
MLKLQGVLRGAFCFPEPGRGTAHCGWHGARLGGVIGKVHDGGCSDADTLFLRKVDGVCIFLERWTDARVTLYSTCLQTLSLSRLDTRPARQILP